MRMATSRELKFLNIDELRDLLPFSGLFDMLDCNIELQCPLNAAADDVQRIVHLVESMINVIDVRVTGIPQPDFEDSYGLIITDVPYSKATQKKAK